MIYPIAQGIQVSFNYNPSNGSGTWYRLSDHNRDPIQISYEIIENSQRMSNGTMRKYVIAKKLKVTTDWKDFPSQDVNLVDYNSGSKGAAWIKAFYEANVFQPVWVKIVYSQETIPAQNQIPNDASYHDSKTSQAAPFLAFMTSFKYDVNKRTHSSSNSVGYDYTTVNIEFTEV